MNILITAGGTFEPIDHVRAITNHSTGRLGKEIATAFLQAGHTVTYITTATALKLDENPLLSTQYIETAQDLQLLFQHLFEKNQYDAIIHSMAVSDFTLEMTLSEEQLLADLAKNLHEKQAQLHTIDDYKIAMHRAIQSLATQTTQAKKISSSTEHLLLFLKKNPKIIAMIRQAQPQATIVGFKLLVDVSEAQLLETAQQTLRNNQCDFILANDLTQLTDTTHRGLLVDANGEVAAASTKPMIAQLILQKVTHYRRLNK